MRHLINHLLTSLLVLTFDFLVLSLLAVEISDVLADLHHLITFFHVLVVLMALRLLQEFKIYTQVEVNMMSTRKPEIAYKITSTVLSRIWFFIKANLFIGLFIGSRALIEYISITV